MAKRTCTFDDIDNDTDYFAGPRQSSHSLNTQRSTDQWVRKFEAYLTAKRVTYCIDWFRSSEDVHQFMKRINRDGSAAVPITQPAAVLTAAQPAAVPTAYSPSLETVYTALPIITQPHPQVSTSLVGSGSKFASNINYPSENEQYGWNQMQQRVKRQRITTAETVDNRSLSDKQTVKDLLQAASTDKLVILERAVDFLYDHWKPIPRNLRSAPSFTQLKSCHMGVQRLNKDPSDRFVVLFGQAGFFLFDGFSVLRQAPLVEFCRVLSQYATSLQQFLWKCSNYSPVSNSFLAQPSVSLASQPSFGIQGHEDIPVQYLSPCFPLVSLFDSQSGYSDIDQG
ncbi:hypothetical protein MP228_010687 [Amoeboaphelidium protococcarum]|nr:hypothetical protein MP228_010687 [Amoeboaphelidium protococcarum]